MYLRKSDDLLPSLRDNLLAGGLKISLHDHVTASGLL